MKVMLVAGARPNFMKIASIIDAIKSYNVSIENSKFNIQHFLVHSGQHYDDAMSDAFFRDLELPRPDIHLDVGSASHAVQTAEIMKRFEPVLLKEQPDVVVVVGDVNSTIACTLVASKIQYAFTSNQQPATSSRRRPLIAHVEAGLRSFDRSMPEEINRILTDQLSDFLFVSEESGIKNLKKEGFRNFLDEEVLLDLEDNSTLNTQHSLPLVAFVGNTMIDTLLKHREIANRSDVLERLNLLTSNWRPAICIQQPEASNQKPATGNQQPATSKPVIPYAVLTLHRPSNVDDKGTFKNILEALLEVSKRIPILFPVHPRTLNRIKEFEFERFFYSTLMSQSSSLSPQHLSPTHYSQPPRIFSLDPLGYLDFLCLMSNSKLILTDSGGIQEETTALGIPCITLRENTERPVTVTCGTNMLTGVQKEQIISASLSQLQKYDSTLNIQHSALSTQSSAHSPQSCSPPLWDGRAGERIIDVLVNHFRGKIKSRDQQGETCNERPAPGNQKPA